MKDLLENLGRISDPFCDSTLRVNALDEVLCNQLISFSDPAFPLYKMDLHLHSNYSDGYWTPTGLVLEAHRRGMKCISLTDHDSFDGIEEIFKARDRIENFSGNKIDIIPGIELSTFYTKGDNLTKEIHILGYFPSIDYKKFQSYLARIDIFSKAYLEALQKCRIFRIFEMVKKFNEELPPRVGGALLELSKIGQPITLQTAKRGLRGSVAPGRLLTCTGIYEIVQLQKIGRLGEVSDETFSEAYIKNLVSFMAQFNSPHELMEKYFGHTEPSAKVDYIGRTFTSEEAVNFINRLGGIAVLAHPILYPNFFQSILETLAPIGLKGVEIVSGNAKRKDMKVLLDMEEYIEKSFPNLIVFAGSDCHGYSFNGHLNYTPDNPIGLYKHMKEFLIIMNKHEEKIKIALELEGGKRPWV
jgi:3',5'-nucleoside bisphosphate phosphatase